MLNVIETYQDVLDTIDKEANGNLSYALFNRLSRRAELRLIDWLSGDVANEKAPIPFLSQKNKDWLSPFIKQFSTHAVDGRITRPSDYYKYDNMFRLSNGAPADCDEEDVITAPDNHIELLASDVFNIRQETYIDELKNKLMAKMVGRDFLVHPKDIGSVVLEYIRYPLFGSIKVKPDPVYNDEVPDTALSQNYEWDEGSREALVWFIADSFANRQREMALKQMNAATGKTPQSGG